MEKKLTKNQKGITLVALIITIIVLLILAIVSIRAIKDGGILNKTQTVKATYSEAEEKEKIKLAINQAAIDGIGTIKEDYITPALNEQFGENNWEYTQKKEGEYLIVKIEASKRSYKINIDGTVQNSNESSTKEDDEQEKIRYMLEQIYYYDNEKEKNKYNNYKNNGAIELIGLDLKMNHKYSYVFITNNKAYNYFMDTDNKKIINLGAEYNNEYINYFNNSEYTNFYNDHMKLNEIYIKLYDIIGTKIETQAKDESGNWKIEIEINDKLNLSGVISNESNEMVCNLGTPTFTNYELSYNIVLEISVFEEKENKAEATISGIHLDG